MALTEMRHQLLSEFGQFVNLITGLDVLYFILVALLAAGLGVLVTWQFAVIIVFTVIFGVVNYYAGKWS